MGMVNSNVLFSLGVVGGSKVKGEMLAVAGALAFVGSKIWEGVKAADAFSQQWKRLSDTQRDVVISMGTATKDLVDTGQAMKTVVKLTEAGIKPTKELGNAIGTLAVDRIKKLGGSYDDIQKKVDQLTDSVAKGNTKALKEFGIELEEGRNLTELQSDAIKKLTKRAEDLEPITRELKDQWNALNNNFGTGTGLAWDWLNTNENIPGVLGDISDYFAKVNEVMGRSRGAFNDMIFSTEGLILTFRKLWYTLTNNQEALKKTNQVAGAFFKQKFTEAVKKAPATGAAPVAQAKKSTMGGKGGGGPSAADQAAALEKQNESAIDRAEKLMDKYIADQEQLRSDQAEMEMKDIHANEQANQAKLESDLDHLEQKVEAFKKAKEAEFAIAQDYSALEEGAVENSTAIWKSGLQAKVGMFQSTLGNLSSLMLVESKKAFNVGKAAAIAEAVINTALAAVKAYQSMAGIPYVGPALGAAAAAAAIIAGGVQIAQIKKTKYGGGGGAAAGGGGGGGISISGGAGGPGMGGGGFTGGADFAKGEGGGQVTNYIVYGGVYTTSELADELKNHYNKNKSTGKWQYGWESAA